LEPGPRHSAASSAKREAQQRAWQAEQRERERAQRAAIRAQARDQREALRAYQHVRKMDAAARSSELDAQVTRLTCILQSVLATPPFQLEQLIRKIAIPPFAPGPLSIPVVLSDQRSYQVPPPSGLRALSSAGRDHQEACRRAQEQFEVDCRAATHAEERRQRQFAEYHRQYRAWAGGERQNEPPTVTDWPAQCADGRTWLHPQTSRCRTPARLIRPRTTKLGDPRAAMSVSWSSPISCSLVSGQLIRAC